jgi:hypothetical protein
MNNIFCYKCHIPKTKENYFEDKNNKTGLKSYCKDCCNKYKAEKITCEYCNYTRRRDSYYRHLKSKKHISIVPQPYNSIGKVYSKCNIDKSLYSFHVDKTNKDEKIKM